MLSYQEIFNLKRTTLPLTKKELEGILSKSIFSGYVQCPYNVLIQTLKDIQKSELYQCSINPEWMYQGSNNPLNKAEVIIQIEGIRYYEEFINRVISNEGSNEWTDFITYSETFKDELRVLKSQVISKVLWNVNNLNNWYESQNVALLQSVKDRLSTDWETFKTYVLLTDDLQGFISSCNENDLKKASKLLSYNLCKKLQKYKPELMKHINNNSKRELVITVKKPIVKRIFIISSLVGQCKKDWPILQVTALDKKIFDTISLWED